MIQNDNVLLSHEEAVRCYYRLVDANNIEGLLLLFAADSEYRRPGFAPLHGRKDLERFYRQDRQIARGAHSIIDLVSTADRTAVQGNFVGDLHSGKHIEFGFSDFFAFDDEGRFRERETYFSTPLV